MGGSRQCRHGSLGGQGGGHDNVLLVIRRMSHYTVFNACADPGSFVRGDPTLTTFFFSFFFFFLVEEGRGYSNTKYVFFYFFFIYLLLIIR